jgi:hypothetical protein
MAQPAKGKQLARIVAQTTSPLNKKMGKSIQLVIDFD